MLYSHCSVNKHMDKPVGVHGIWEDLFQSWPYILNTKDMSHDNGNTNPYNECKSALVSSQCWHRADTHETAVAPSCASQFTKPHLKSQFWVLSFSSASVPLTTVEIGAGSEPLV